MLNEEQLRTAVAGILNVPVEEIHMVEAVAFRVFVKKRNGSTEYHRIDLS